MIVADKYLDLKVVETWRELETELQQKHFKCFYSDQVMLRTINERNRKWALRLQIAQKECIRRQREKVQSRNILFKFDCFVTGHDRGV